MSKNNTKVHTRGDEKIVIIGFGWIGQANALALVELGYDVYFYDVLPPRHHYEKTHARMYERVTSLDSALEVDGENTSYMVCVGDRVSEEGEQDLTFIAQALDSLRKAKGAVVLRSTIVPKSLSRLPFDFYVPEFLHEKFAIEECKEPYYFVVGSGTNAREISLPGYLAVAYERSQKKFSGTYTEASFIKYYSNMWNAVRIAFINELGDIIADTSTTDHPVADAERVIDFMFEGKSYLRYGKGYDGHCLPKDMRAFLAAYSSELNTHTLAGAHRSNTIHDARDVTKNVLPKWFSAWDYDSILSSQKEVFGIFLKKVYGLPLLVESRRLLKPLVVAGEQIIPPKSLEESRVLWEEKAKLNARYYTNPKTKSGELVDESEIKQTGEADYVRYVVEDHAIQALIAKQGKKQITVLDLGSGIGRMTEFFARDFARVEGIDISPTMVESARRRLSGFANVEFKKTEGRSIPALDGSFDLIFSYLVLQHVGDEEVIKNYLREIARTLTDDGVAKIQLRANSGQVRRWVWSYGLAYDPADAVRMVKEAGLKLVRDPYVEDLKSLWLVVSK